MPESDLDKLEFVKVDQRPNPNPRTNTKLFEPPQDSKFRVLATQTLDELASIVVLGATVELQVLARFLNPQSPADLQV
jgi:hypothetical protein